MSYVAKTAETYSANITQKLNDNDGKVFLVEYSKSCAVKILLDVLSSKDSHFILVENRRIAKDLMTLLQPELGTFTLIDSMAAFEKYLNNADLHRGSSQADFVSKAQVLRSRFPRVIFTFKDEDTGAELLHAALCKDSTRNGTYEGVPKRSEFCVSDLLAACEYESVVIDGVYSYLSFEQEGLQVDKPFTCGEYERMDFLGEAYYMSRSYSYRRLRNIVNASKKCILISDVIASGKAIELYAALNMLHEKFSMKEAKAKVSKLTSYYDADCDDLLSNLSLVDTEQNVISSWLRAIKNEKQTVPGDMEDLATYVRDNLKYMSEEERFLRAVIAAIEANTGRPYDILETLLEQLDSNPQTKVNMLKQMFFSDQLKGEIESVLKHGNISEMTSEEIGGMYAVFLRYGVCHHYQASADSTKVLRFRRDDCGFEYFVAREGDMRTLRPDDEYSYSIIHCGSTTLYKAIALQRMMDGRDARGKVVDPIMVVTRVGVNDIVKELKNVFTDYEYTTNIRDFTKKTAKTIAVVTYDALLETPFWLEIGTVVFFDVLPDGIGMKNAVEKALGYGDAKAYVLADYGNLSGHFVDEWQDGLFSGKKVLPINGAQINVKESKKYEYCTILQELDKMYRLLYKITTCGDKDCVNSSLEQYNHVITEYTLHMRPLEGVLQRDFSYLASLKKEYQRIFKNCMSIGGEGERTISENYQLRRRAKKNSNGKGQTEEYYDEVDTSESRYVFFNACTSMLLRNCDWRLNNCNGCESYDKFLVNDFACFRDNIFTLLEETKYFIREAEKYQWIRSSQGLIRGSSDELATDCLVMEEVEGFEQEALEIFEKLRQGKDDKGVFWVDYDSADALRTIARKTYCKILQKYYSKVMEIFNNATEKAKASFDVINGGLAYATREV